MHRRRTTMFDGRTMYYYSFGDDALADEARAEEAHADEGREREGSSGATTEELDV
ncbi:MAG TPA: hypothetical protein VNA88_07480 [Candidatus Kapabacteria bacterium]|nr:hypothetical protein [Candidatus Kapabacteria bacterium]